MPTAIFDETVLYNRKGDRRDRTWMYLIIAQGQGWVRIVINQGAVPGKPVTLVSDEFERDFEASTEQVQS